MEPDQGAEFPGRPNIQLQASTFSTYSESSLSPSFKVDEGYSDETRSQSEKEIINENVMMLPEWVLAQSETNRAELAYSLLRSLSTTALAGLVERLNPLLHMDPVVKLPPELTFQIFSYLEPRTLLNATLASRSWRSRILDSGLWRVLYIDEGWRVDTKAIRRYELEHSEVPSPQIRKSRPRHSESDLGEPKHKKRVPSEWLISRNTEEPGATSSNGPASILPDNEGDHHMTDANDRASIASPDGAGAGDLSSTPILQIPSLVSPPLQSSLLMRNPDGSTKLNWIHLYKQRRRLEANWHHGRYTNFQLPDPSHPEEAHKECVYAIQFQGRWLVSGSRDRTVRVWNLETKRLWHRPLVGHLKSVLCLQFDPSPEEDVIISGSSDRSVIIWGFSTGRKIHKIENAHADSVLNLKFDHRYLVTCSKDRTVKVWNRRNLYPTQEDYPRICRSGGATYPSYIVDLNEYSPSALETGLANGQIKGLPAYAMLMVVEGHGAAVNAMQLHGDEIVTASGDRTIKVWNIRTGTCVKTLMGHEKGIACVQFDSRRIISGSNDNTVRIYDHISGAEVACLRGHNNLVRTVQAGFGDPPGADETLRQEALEVENAFWKAQQEGETVDLGPRAMRRAGYHANTAGSRNPRDIRAIGAKIPPGGGGSSWGRIVSGSYDESILIWHKDRDGAWSIGHRLRQSDAVANVVRANLNEAARMAVATQAQQLQAAQVLMTMPAGQNPAQESTDQASERAENEAGPATENGNDDALIHVAEQQGPNDHEVEAEGAANPTPQPPLTINAQALSALAVAPHQPGGPGRRPVHNPPTSRVFKVQFDSRKIICASVDPRIVGWDFACGDEDIEEACPFFQGL